jgi:hypothetical protein
MSMKRVVCGAAGLLMAGLAVAGGPVTNGPDVQVCLLYDLEQYERTGNLNGLSIATTSYNAGDENLLWYSPYSGTTPELHPMITYNLYRMTDDGRRVEQIGVSWIKHGFLATNTGECEQRNACNGSFGSELSPDCSDTYGSSLNRSLSYLGPRYEVNPWTGAWTQPGSILATNEPIQSSVDRLMIVHDDDFDPALNDHANVTYIAEGYYVASDDVDHMNSASYRPVGDPVWSGGEWNLASGSSFSPDIDPIIGFVFQEWGGTESMVSESGAAPVEGVSTDGRAYLSSKVFDNGDGTYDYEYVLFNVDLDAQIDAINFPIPSGATVTNASFYGVPHYETMSARADEGGVPIDSSDWNISQTGTSLVFSTSSNPLRWGMMFNFSFTADVPPTTGDIELSPFKSSAGVSSYLTSNQVPEPQPTVCQADIDKSGSVDFQDFLLLSGQFGQSGPSLSADMDGSGTVDFQDFLILSGEFGTTGC